MPSKIWVISFLGISGLWDIKTMTIPRPLVFIYLVASPFLTLAFHWVVWQQMLGGILVGMIYLVLARITKGAIGMGDGFVYLILGICIGGWETLGIALCAQVLGALVGLLLFVKNRNLKQRFPFVPVIGMAYGLYMAGVT